MLTLGAFAFEELGCIFGRHLLTKFCGQDAVCGIRIVGLLSSRNAAASPRSF
jgi:hypothetical protein